MNINNNYGYDLEGSFFINRTYQEGLCHRNGGDQSRLYILETSFVRHIFYMHSVYKFSGICSQQNQLATTSKQTTHEYKTFFERRLNGASHARPTRDHRMISRESLR